MDLFSFLVMSEATVTAEVCVVLSDLKNRCGNVLHVMEASPNFLRIRVSLQTLRNKNAAAGGSLVGTPCC